MDEEKTQLLAKIINALRNMDGETLRSAAAFIAALNPGESRWDEGEERDS